MRARLDCPRGGHIETRIVEVSANVASSEESVSDVELTTDEIPDLARGDSQARPARANAFWHIDGSTVFGPWLH